MVTSQPVNMLVVTGCDVRMQQEDYLSFILLHCYYLVGIVEEVNRDAEWQRVVIRIPQQYRKNLHTGWPCLSLPLLLRALHGALAVDGILSHFSPENNREKLENWYIIVYNY